MKIHIQPIPPAGAVRVLLAWSGPKKVEWMDPPLNLRPVLDEFLIRTRFKAEAGTAFFLPGSSGSKPQALIVAGAGSPSTAAVGMERASAAAARIARKNGITDLAFDLTDGAKGTCLDSSSLAFRIARGAQEGTYRFARYLTDSVGVGPTLRRIVLCGPGDRAAAVAARAGALEGEVFNEVRDLANQPGNIATPDAIAAAASDLAGRFGLRYSVLRRSQLEKKGFHALLAVSQGSQNDPCLIVLEHAGKRASSQRPLVFVGKTITFDSGGLSLKQAKGMEWMRYDKCGGMAVLAAMAAAGALDLPGPAVGILAAAENMPDGKATRPGDIIRSLAGPTIEILNTDAEGRLVLADALAWSNRFHPAAIVDLATLTGAVIVALGNAAAAVLSPDDALSARLQRLGEKSGDRLWPLPLWPEYDKALESPFADLRNIGDGSAGTISGAAFLKRFVPAKVPWAHLDIAGTAWEEKETSWRAPGATLFGAKLLTEWLRQPERNI